MSASPPEPAEQRALLCAALRGVALGRQAALSDLYDRTSAKLFGICLRILNDRGEAEEALQEVFISVWNRAASFDASRASPISWLATIARNRAIDRLRSGARQQSAATLDQAAEVPDREVDALSRLEASEERLRLTGCMDELEQRHSEAIRTAFFDGLSYAELAARSGVPLGTMKSWIRRSLLKLRECLDR
jgi:RNA polymerase sigma-70 factor (ECF subfamily)